MQETVDRETENKLQEYFTGETPKDVQKSMDKRLQELANKGHTLVRRIEIGRNDSCPCNSGKKFKKCCIDKIKEVLYETR